MIADAIPLIDAHHHLWDLSRNRHPWLQDEPMIPFRYGDYSPLRRDYLPVDYRADIAGFAVQATVAMEGEWEPADPVGESRWMAKVAARAGLPQGFVARAFLDRDDVGEVLAAHAGISLVRGVRHKPDSAAMSGPAWRRGFAMLSAHGFSFDLQTPHSRLREALDLAEAFPETQIVLDHAGLPADRSPAGLAAWRNNMALAARAPNVAVKISGLGLNNRPWRPEDNIPIVRQVIEIFGIDRCMFASNFPVDKLRGAFGVIFGAYLAAVADLPAADRARLFHGNAAKIYRLSLPGNGAATRD